MITYRTVLLVLSIVLFGMAAQKEETGVEKQSQDKEEQSESSKGKVSTTDREEPVKPKALDKLSQVETIRFEGINCPKGMLGIKAVMGKIGKQEKAYCIDVYEFPNKLGKFPMNQVTWHQAQKFCKERGKRLCRDSEWLAACQGPESYKYPYSNQYNGSRCVTEKKYFVKVGTLEGCRSVYGVHDMVGNVAEWTSGGGVVAFGGYWKSGKSAKCKKWQPHAIDGKYNYVGFRCCMDAVQ